MQRQRDLEVSDVYLHRKKWFGMDKISCVNDFDPFVPSPNFTRSRTGWIGVRARVKLVRVSKNSARLGRSIRSIIRSFFSRRDCFTHCGILTHNFVFNLQDNILECFFGSTEINIIPLLVREYCFYHLKPVTTAC